MLLKAFVGCLAFICSSFASEDAKLPFTCSQEDIQFAGLTCPESQPCPIYLELSSVSSSGNRIFLAGNLHSSETTLYSILLASDDAGATWHDATDRSRGEDLDHIQFENLKTGFVSGQRAVPLNGDPFFLITHDGGRTWQKSLIFPEGSPGVIKDFHFDSETSGKILIDHGRPSPDQPQFKLLETRDGAATWLSLESSNSQIKNAPAHDEEHLWRIRTDKSTQTFSIEHLLDGKWIPASRFPVQVGQCRE